MSSNLSQYHGYQFNYTYLQLYFSLNSIQHEFNVYEGYKCIIHKVSEKIVSNRLSNESPLVLNYRKCMAF